MEFLPGRILADPKCREYRRRSRQDIRFDERRARPYPQRRLPRRRLGDFGREGQYIERQLNRWSSQYDLPVPSNIESMEPSKAWLPANIPPGDETRINHGDYRLGNTIVHPTEPRSSPFSTGASARSVIRWRPRQLHDVPFRGGFGASGGYASRSTWKESASRPRKSISPPTRAAPDGRKCLELLSRLLAVPARRHRAGRLQARPRRQCLLGDRHQVRQPPARAWPTSPGRWSVGSSQCLPRHRLQSGLPSIPPCVIGEVPRRGRGRPQTRCSCIPTSESPSTAAIPSAPYDGAPPRRRGRNCRFTRRPTAPRRRRCRVGSLRCRSRRWPGCDSARYRSRALRRAAAAAACAGSTTPTAS